MFVVSWMICRETTFALVKFRILSVPFHWIVTSYRSLFMDINLNSNGEPPLFSQLDNFYPLSPIYTTVVIKMGHITGNTATFSSGEYRIRWYYCQNPCQAYHLKNLKFHLNPRDDDFLKFQNLSYLGKMSFVRWNDLRWKWTIACCDAC